MSNDPLKYVKELQRLLKDEQEKPDFSSKEEPFWRRCSEDIFKCNPTALKGISFYNG